MAKQEGSLLDFTTASFQTTDGFIHLEIAQGGIEAEVEKTGTQVFLVYNDTFTCGACSIHTTDLLEFLQHKSDHLIGEGLYKCELCKVVWLKKSQLLKHYILEHKIPNLTITADDALTIDPALSQLKEETILDRNGSALNNQVNENVINLAPESMIVNYVNNNIVPQPLPMEINTVSRGTETSAQNGAEETIDTSQQTTNGSFELETDNGLGDLTAEKPVDESEDFHFVLTTESVKGKRLNYNRTWLKCLHCDYKTRMKAVLQKHMKERHIEYMDIHNKIDIKPPVLTNDVENAVLTKLSEYDKLHPLVGKKKMRRRERQDMIGSFTCQQCSKEFTRMRYLKKHLQTHRTNKEYTCEQCGKSFKSQAYLYTHKRIHAEKRFQCNQCDFSSCITAAIHAHRQIHSQGSVLCDICGYAYTDKGTLMKHKRVHDLSRPFVCNFPGCTWRFKTEMMCKAHIRAHTTEGKFKCSYCGYVFRHKHHLQRHETRMHGVVHDKQRTKTTTYAHPPHPPSTSTNHAPINIPVINNPISINHNSINIAPHDDQHKMIIGSEMPGTVINSLDQNVLVDGDMQDNHIEYSASSISALIMQGEQLQQEHNVVECDERDLHDERALFVSILKDENVE